MRYVPPMKRLTISGDACIETLALLITMAWADGRLDDHEKKAFARPRSVFNLTKELRERLEELLAEADRPRRAPRRRALRSRQGVRLRRCGLAQRRRRRCPRQRAGASRRARFQARLHQRAPPGARDRSPGTSSRSARASLVDRRKSSPSSRRSPRASKATGRDLRGRFRG